MNQFIEQEIEVYKSVTYDYTRRMRQIQKHRILLKFSIPTLRIGKITTPIFLPQYTFSHKNK